MEMNVVINLSTVYYTILLQYIVRYTYTVLYTYARTIYCTRVQCLQSRNIAFIYNFSL